MSKKRKSAIVLLSDQKNRLIKPRLFAYLIDWLIIALIINAIIVFGRSVELGVVTNNNYLPSFEGYSGYFYGFACLLASFLYMVILPFFSKQCQTIGKKMTHLTITTAEGFRPDLFQLSKRFLITLLFEPALYQFSLVFYTMLSMASGVRLHTVFTIWYWGMTTVSLILGATGQFGGMFHERFGKVKKEDHK